MSITQTLYVEPTRIKRFPLPDPQWIIVTNLSEAQEVTFGTGFYGGMSSVIHLDAGTDMLLNIAGGAMLQGRAGTPAEIMARDSSPAKISVEMYPDYATASVAYCKGKGACA